MHIDLSQGHQLYVCFNPPLNSVDFLLIMLMVITEVTPD